MYIRTVDRTNNNNEMVTNVSVMIFVLVIVSRDYRRATERDVFAGPNFRKHIIALTNWDDICFVSVKQQL